MLWTKAPYSADLTQTAGVADDDRRFVSGFPFLQLLLSN